MWFLRNRSKNSIIYVNAENIKLVAPNFDWLGSSSEETIHLLNNLNINQIQILFKTSNKIQIKNLEGNIETLNNTDLDILEFPLSQTEFDTFFNGKLAHLPYIKKDRLQLILNKQFGITTGDYTQNQLRDIARDIISENILNNERQNTSSENSQDKNNSNNITESSEKLNNDSNNKKEIKTKMALKSMLHQPQCFSGKAGEDVDIFIENFDLSAIINDWSDEDKIILLPLYLKETAAKFFKLIKIKNSEIKWEDAKTQIKNKFTVIGNNKLMRIQLNQRKLESGESLNEFVINMTELCYKIDPEMREEEICEKILGGLTDEIYDKIEILDNTTINKLTDNLNRYELAKMVRKKEEKQNGDVEKLNNEVNILKRHIQQLNLEVQNKSIQPNFVRWPNDQQHNNRRFNNNNGAYNRGYNGNQQVNPYQGNYINQYSQNPRFNHNQDVHPPSDRFRNQSNSFSNFQYPNNPRPPPTCYGCGVLGHIRRDCPTQKN